MIYTRLLANVDLDEGLRLSPYQDIEGVWTIGDGETMIGDQPVTENTPPITRAFATMLTRNSLFQACEDAQRFFPALTSLSDIRQEVLAEMAYQLGYSGICQFINFKAALVASDWQTAANHMRSSLWATQTPTRVEKLATLMEAG